MGDAVEKAYSGHLGLPMGCAPMPILFDEIMRYNPKRTHTGSIAMASCSPSVMTASPDMIASRYQNSKF